MNKTDLVGYIALVGVLATGLKELIISSQPKTLTDWLVVVLGSIGLVAFAFYDKLTGTKAEPK